MGKKTLKQKRRADEKKLHQTHPMPHNTIGNKMPVPTLTYTFPSQPVTTAKHTNSSPHSQMTYVAQDLRKTLLLSVVIVILQVVLYVSLHNHILALPFIRY